MQAGALSAPALPLRVVAFGGAARLSASFHPGLLLLRCPVPAWLTERGVRRSLRVALFDTSLRADGALVGVTLTGGGAAPSTSSVETGDWDRVADALGVSSKPLPRHAAHSDGVVHRRGQGPWAWTSCARSASSRPRCAPASAAAASTPSSASPFAT